MLFSALRIGRSFNSFNYTGILACQGQLCGCCFAVRVLLYDKVNYADQNMIHRECNQTKNQQTMTLNFKCRGLRAKQWRKRQHTYLLPVSIQWSKLLTSVCSILNDFQALFLPQSTNKQGVKGKMQALPMFLHTKTLFWNPALLQSDLKLI